jgi:ADP-heptose:LPS heptosyltransferase
MMGKLSLPELISFLNKAHFVVAASTGPLHIASALGRNTVGLYSPRKPIWPRRWAPIGKHASWITAPSHPSPGEPLGISPQEVCALIESRLFPEADSM